MAAPDLEQVNDLGERLMAAGRVEEARALLELAADRDKGNALYANNRAVARYQLGDLTGAVRDLERALVLPDGRRLATLNYAAIAESHPRFVQRALAHCRGYLASGAADEGGQIARALQDLTGQLAKIDAWVRAWVGGMPAHALSKVTHTKDVTSYLEIGEKLASALLTQFDGLTAAETILDFGVGLGRVLWPLLQHIPTADFIAYDVDPIMIKAVGKVREMADVRLLHSLGDIPDASVDAVFVISVFTHLDVTTDYWLCELKRVLKRGGRAFITFHDDSVYRELYDANGLARGSPREFRGRFTTGQGAQGSTFMASFYECAEWERTVARFFRVLKTVPRGVVGYQSFSLVEKVDDRNDVLAHQGTYARDLENELYRLRERANLEF